MLSPSVSSPSDDYSKQKQFKSDVKKLNTQVQYLGGLTNHLFSDAFEEDDWFNGLSDIRQKTQSILERLKSKKHEDYLSKLEKVKNDCFAGSEEFEKVRKESDLDKLIQGLEAIHSNVINPNETLLEELREKLERKYANIQIWENVKYAKESSIREALRKLVLKTEKFWPNIAIVGELRKSLEIDVPKREKFNKLRDAWLDAFESHCKLNDETRKSIIRSHFHKNYDPLKNQLISVREYLNEFKPMNVTLKKLYTVEDGQIDKDLEQYGKQAKEFKVKCQEFEDLVKAWNAFNINMTDTENELQKAIVSVKKRTAVTQNLRDPNRANFDSKIHGFFTEYENLKEEIKKEVLCFYSFLQSAEFQVDLNRFGYSGGMNRINKPISIASLGSLGLL